MDEARIVRNRRVVRAKGITGEELAKLTGASGEDISRR